MRVGVGSSGAIVSCLGGDGGCTPPVMLGSEVFKSSKFWSKHQTSKNIFNQIVKALRYQELMLLLSSMYKKTYFNVHLKEFSKLLKYSASSDIHMITRYSDLLFKALHQERKRRKEKIPTILT